MAQLNHNYSESLKIIKELKALKGVKCNELIGSDDNLVKIYFQNNNFELTCDFDGHKNLRTNLRFTHFNQNEIELFKLMSEKGL
jgi:hypothetical protein